MKNNSSKYEKIPERDKHFFVRTLYTQSGLGFPPHWHEQWELLFFSNGGGRIACGGEEFCVSAGDLAIVNPNEVHFFAADKPAQYFGIIIPTSFYSEFGYQEVALPHLISGDAQIAGQISLMSALRESRLNDETGRELEEMGIAFSLMAYLLRNYRTTPRSATSREAMRVAQIKSVLSDLSLHYREKISVAELAKKYFLSEYYFCHWFQKEVGCSVLSYVNHLRLTQASELLNNTDWSVAKIANEVGFNDGNYFSRLFRRQYKLSPSAYRQRKSK